MSYRLQNSKKINFFISNETIKSQILDLKIGDKINLEKSLTLVKNIR